MSTFVYKLRRARKRLTTMKFNFFKTTDSLFKLRDALNLYLTHAYTPVVKHIQPEISVINYNEFLDCVWLHDEKYTYVPNAGSLDVVVGDIPLSAALAQPNLGSGLAEIIYDDFAEWLSLGVKVRLLQSATPGYIRWESFREFTRVDQDYSRHLFYMCNFSGCDLAGASFYNSHLVRCNLSGADLSEVDFDRCVLEHCDMTGARINSATKLHDAILRATRLHTKLP